MSELSNAGSAFAPEPVHDLRVAIRRCRSMAEGLRSVDPGPGWKQFRSLPKPLFTALGELRDTQVLLEWLDLLAASRSRAARSLQETLRARIVAQTLSAKEAVGAFDAKRWLKLGGELDLRASKLPPGSRVFQHLALERWGEAVHLHETAMRTRRSEDLHQLRIGIKRFRYTVENFLPERHKRWGKDLKQLQDVLGDIHDLDVLSSEIEHMTVAAAGAPPKPGFGLGGNGPSEELTVRIQAERGKRLQEYQGRTIGHESLWTQWREGLPSGRDLSLAVNAKLRHWARTVDPQPAHSRRVAQVGAKLWNELRRELGWKNDRRTAALLRSAALLHNVGGEKRRRKRQPFREKVLQKLSAPVGWSEQEMRMLRAVSRYGYGGFPSINDEDFRALSPGEQQQALRLTGILQLADVLDSTMTPVAGFVVKKTKNALALLVPGWDPLSETAIDVAAARHLLETVLGMPILIRPAAMTSAAAS